MMGNIKIAIIVVLLCFTSSAFSQCTINVNGGLGEPQPLLINPGTSSLLYPPTKTGIISLTANQQIELYCSSGFASPSGAGTSITVSCSTNNQFLFNNVRYDFIRFYCSGFVASAAKKTTSRCYNNGYVFEHGFPVGTRFIKLYDACHDTVREETYYVKHALTPAIGGYQVGYTRPNFVTGGHFGGKDVDRLYTRATQRNTISGIVGSYDLALKYIEETSDVFMSRGHLAAKADFIYGNEQRATFYFTNVAPQWQKFNALNWGAVEDGSRNLAVSRNINLDVYSGTFGTMQLKDTSNVLRDIFLYVSGSTKQIPVPKLFYKIVHNKAANSGVVFLGVNNPHLTLDDIKKSYIICTDVSSRINYISWQKDNIERGYSYACEVNDFLKVVPHVSLNVPNLLV